VIWILFYLGAGLAIAVLAWLNDAIRGGEILGWTSGRVLRIVALVTVFWPLCLFWLAEREVSQRRRAQR
jgi:sugar phosphate permease